MGLFKSKLTRTVSLLSSVAFIIMGFVLSGIISQHIATDAINAKIEAINFALDIAVESSQIQNELAKEQETASDQLLLTHLNASLNVSGASDFIVWENQGKEVLRKIPATSFMPTAPTAEFSDAGFERILAHSIIQDAGQTGSKSLKIDAMVAVPTSEKRFFITVLFPFQEVQKHQTMLNRNIAAAIGGGLFLLYILLLRVLTDTSRTLIQQKDALGVKNRELEDAYARLNTSFHSTVHALADAVDARDPYTAGHVDRVMTYSAAMGKALGLQADEQQQLVLAAQLHDIGKIGISDAILLKPGKLTLDEYEIIKSHPAIGVGILKNVPDLASILPGVLHHHERYDGKGYPYGLENGKIPVIAKIIAVADSYDAMTTNRPYRLAMSHEDAVKELGKNRNVQYDPDIVDTFLRILHENREVL